MWYILNMNIKELSEKWNVSERTVRNYCQQGKIIGAFKEGRSWMIPNNAKKPIRKKRTCKVSNDLLTRLKMEKEAQISGGIYHQIQIDLTYNSNHMEGGRLTHDQTRYIFETHTIGIQNDQLNVDDIVETVNHFHCIDLMIDLANYKLSESFIKQLHLILKSSTSDSRKSWFAVGDYKKMENEVGGSATCLACDVPKEMKSLLKRYNKIEKKSLKDLIEFHYEFEKIHPFQDGNGRVGRLILFKECLRYRITPFIISDDLKLFYYRGLKEWCYAPGYLMDTCLMAQDRMKQKLDYFGIKYEN
jgi:Fic family protein